MWLTALALVDEVITMCIVPFSLGIFEACLKAHKGSEIQIFIAMLLLLMS